MKKRDLLFIVVSGFILVIVWMGFNIYHSAITSTIPEATSIQIAPITPRFDTETINGLKSREKTSPVFERNISPTPQATTSAVLETPTIIPSPTTLIEPTSTPSATITP